MSTARVPPRSSGCRSRRINIGPRYATTSNAAAKASTCNEGRPVATPHRFRRGGTPTRIGFDGQNQQLLTKAYATHDVTMSPSGRYFVDNYSTPEVPPIAVVRDADGQDVMPLEKADISKLAATGWKTPTPIMVKARDGV